MQGWGRGCMTAPVVNGYCCVLCYERHCEMCIMWHRLVTLYWSLLFGIARGSVSAVLTPTGSLNGRGQFSTPHRIHTPWPMTKIVSDYVSDRYGSAKFGANSKSVHGGGGFCTNGWNITKFIYTFFRELTYRSDASTDFHAWWLKRRGLAQECVFFLGGGVSLILLPISGNEIIKKAITQHHVDIQATW